MSDLVRFGVAMDRALLTEFDRRIAKRGYENRSEALRDLVRADLAKSAWDAGEPVTATLTVVLSKKLRAEVARLLERAVDVTIVATLGVAVDDERTMEVVVLRGRAGDLTTLAGKIGGVRGIVGSDLAIVHARDGRGAA
jgi:CopG family nickel-responsive transcriptional regulator